MTRHPITPEGYQTLLAELRNQKEVVRPRIVRDIEEARAQGDISENSEYEDAKERQSHCEGRIAYLEGVVAAAEIIDVTKLPRNGRVVFGTTVLLTDQSNGEERRLRIVGETESNVEAGLISFTSPLGKALIGRSEGDEVSVPTPSGVRKWEVLEVLYEGPSAA
jgi:transcription elongation factor GreA